MSNRLAACKTLGIPSSGRRARLAQPWLSVIALVAVHAATTTSVNLMGRSEHWNPLTKAERKRVKTGRAVRVRGIFVRGFKPEKQNERTTAWNATKRRIALDSRRPSQTSNNWVHAVLFVVLIVIVVSWALGY